MSDDSRMLLSPLELEVNRKKNFSSKALRYAKEAVGTDVRHFPNLVTMVSLWNVHADKIKEAMEYAYKLGKEAKQGGEDAT